jgi:hypothetical protein
MPYAHQHQVDRLEEALQTFVHNVGIEFNKVHNAQLRLTQEMTEFKQEMAEFKDEMRTRGRDMDRRWGALANKMGTLVEDLVVPSLPRIILEQMGEEVIDMMSRRVCRLPNGITYEFDAIARSEALVFLNSTKSTLRPEHVTAFPEEIARFREAFPEFRDKPLVGVLASLSVERDVVRHAERLGFMVLGAGDGVMASINTPGFEPKRWETVPAAGNE